MTKKRKTDYKESYDVFAKCEAFYTGGPIQFTKDGKYILTLCQEELNLFEIETGKVTNFIQEKFEKDVSLFLLAEDDETLVTAGKKGILRHWSFSTRLLKKTWKSLHSGPISYMAFDATTTLLATGGVDSTLKLYDIIGKYYTHNLKGAQGVFSKICFHMLGRELFIFGAAHDYKIHIWSLDSSRHVAALENHCSTVTDMTFDEKNQTMLSAGRDAVVLVWNLPDFKLLKIIPIYEAVESCMLAPADLSLPGFVPESSDTYFITAGDKGLLRVWSVDSLKCVYAQTDAWVPEDAGHDGALVTGLHAVPALKAVAATTFEHHIVLFGLDGLTVQKQFVGYTDDVLCARLMDDRVAVATNSAQIKLFHLPDFSCQLLKSHLDIVLTLDAFQKHPQLLVSGSKDNNVKAWSLDSAACLCTGYGHTASVTAVACCKGQANFFVSGSEDTTLKIWDLPESEGKVSLSARCTVKAHDKYINFIDVSANDKFVATGSQDHTAKIWESSNLALYGTLRGHKKGVWCVQFSPVDLVLATSSGDETIRIWSLSDLSCLKVFEGHEAAVLQVIFISNGTQLLSSASDSNIKLWDIKSNMCIQTLSEHSSKVWTLNVADDETYFVSGGADSNIIIWKDVTQEKALKKITETEEYIEKEQLLKNLVHDQKWLKALGLAISLEKPHQAYSIIKEILFEADGERAIEKVFGQMRPDQREILLKYAIEWLTNTRTCFAAVIIVDFFYKLYDFEELMSIPNIKTYIRDSLPYLDRHYKRLNRKCIDMQILQFVNEKLNMI